ncbi:hypothetical protein FHR59_002306 [Xanthomonas arboricola]|nr:hypothetical protein [Xanthomonas arboricola]
MRLLIRSIAVLTLSLGTLACAQGPASAQNVFAVYAPFGDKGPFFHAHVDGREASLEPAQQNLQQAETIKQDQVRQQAMEQTQQQSVQQERVGTND